MEMVYNNFALTNMIKITDVRRPVIGVRNVNALEINGRHGQLFQNAFYGTKTIEVDFYIKYEYMPTLKDASMFQKVVKSLAYYLTSNTAPAKLIFSDDPNNYYLALVTDITLEQLLKLGQGTITFECFTPFMYSLASYETESQNNLITIDNDGTASTYPIIHTVLSKDATYLTVIGKNGVVQVGNPNGILLGTTATNPTLTYSNMCIDTTQWYKGSPSILWGGRLIDDSVSLIAGRYSLYLNKQPTDEEGSKNYVGGFYMHNLPRAVEYWECKLYFSLACANPDEMGMVDLFLFDENNTVITNFSMRDYYPNLKHNIPMWYRGNKALIWKEEGTATANGASKTYVEQFESLDDVPKGATIIADVQVPKYRAVCKHNGTEIWSYPDKSRGKVLTKGAKGNTYPVKETNASWTSVWMDSAKTTVGYIRTELLSVESDGYTYSVTYKLPVDTASGSGWNNFYGCVIITKTPSPDGKAIWNMRLYNKNNNNSWAGKVIHSISKTVQDSDTQTMTTGSGKLARIGFFLGAYNGATLPSVCQFDDIVVTEYVDENSFDEENGESGFTYIGNAGDTITIDMEEQMVYKNYEPFMEYVDVGSEFFDIDAFTSGEIRIVSDDENASHTASFRKRYI